MTSQKTDTKSSKRTKKALSAEPNTEASRHFEECLRLIADRHGLLIMREISMQVTRFQELQVQTKISPAALISRLRRLENDGIIERRRYNEKPPREEYTATAKGKELDELLFAAGNWDILWGNSGAGSEPSLIVYDKKTGVRLGPTPPKGKDDPTRKRLAE